MRTQIIILLLLVGSINVWSQGEFSLYNLNKSVPQSHQLNPAFYSNHKVVVGFPVLASTHLSLNTDQISFNNIFTQQSNGKYQLNYDKIARNLASKNDFSINSDIQLFFLGLNIKRNHFTLAINERVSSIFTYSDDLGKLAIYGNGDSEILGQKIDFSEIALSQMAYHEIALGYARDINDKLTVGLRLKYLAGVANAEVKDIDGYAITTLDDIYIKHNGFSAYTAGNAYFENEEDISTLITNSLPGKNKNTGYAVDLGANYSINEKISISAAITDLGYINWKNDTKEWQFNSVDYRFKGFEFLEVLDNEDIEAEFEQELDSLEILFTAQENENVSYKSSLVASANIGFDYAFHPNHHVGAMAHGAMISGNLQPAYGIYYNYKPKRIFNSVVNVGFRNGQISLVGVGASLELGPLQIYGTTESLTSLIKPDDARLVDARFGINLVFGKTKKKKKQKVSAPDKLSAINYYEKPETEIEEELEIIDEEIISAPSTASQVVEEPVIVPQGDHKDELEIGHYIVVGAFELRQNAQDYSKKLENDGFENNFGFLTNKDFYYVYVYENTGDIDKAREVRNNYRKINKFQFPNSWLLSVVKSN